MPRTIYEDQFITEYDDGTEEVRFSEEEWAVMLADPAYGYVCRAGKHRLSDSDRQFISIEGVCPGCLGDAEAAAYEEEEPVSMFEVVGELEYDPDEDELYEVEPDEPGNAADRAADREYDRFSDNDPF